MGAPSSLSSAPSFGFTGGIVPRLEDRPLSLRGSSQPIDDSDEGTEDPDEDGGGGRGAHDDGDGSSSEDLAESITSTYNSQATSRGAPKVPEYCVQGFVVSCGRVELVRLRRCRCACGVTA